MNAPERAAEPSRRILVLAPVGRDAPLIAATLVADGMAADVVADLPALIAALAPALPDAPGGVVVAEEALDPRHLPALVDLLGRQPPWSELPFVLLTVAGQPPPARARLIDRLGALGTVTVLERPLRVVTLVSSVRVALRSRVRQYEARDHLLRQQAAADELSAKAAELERSNDELEQFAAVASHDLQEPLRMITSYLSLLQNRYRGLFDDNAKTYFGYVTDGATRMSEMIRAILHYSRIGGSRPQFGEVDAGDALRDALGNLKPKIEASGAEIVADRLPRVRSDRALLAQLLQNLISNAIKFCDQRPLIRIAADDADGEWVFRVTDNGIGFPAEAKPRAFQIFQRFHHKRQIRGTGIGLATCRKIADLHGGRIWVDAAPGGGSTFSFALPRPAAVASDPVLAER